MSSILTRICMSTRTQFNLSRRFTGISALSGHTKIKDFTNNRLTVNRSTIDKVLDLSHNSLETYRCMSTNVPKKSAKERIDELLEKSKKNVFVFMKGVPEQPACGYSNAVVQILNAYEVDYDSFNVLEDDEIRQEIKVYSNWPTIPQVYVDKSFIGGCDILIQMHENDELEKLFDSSTKSST